MRDYARPDTVAMALASLAAGPCQILAGGTDIYPAAGARLAGAVLDLSGIAALQGIEMHATGLRIGACTRWTEIAEAQLPPACHGLQHAARQVGGRQIQNIATIGGNLCNGSPAADGVPPLLVLDAVLELCGPAGWRRLPLAQFLCGPRQTALGPGEILVAVHIPAAALHGVSSFEKLGARAYLVISIAMVAVRVRVENGHIAQAAVAVGACSATARRLTQLETRLTGARLDQALAQIDPADVTRALAPIDDIRATAIYRQGAVVELIRRALGQAMAAA